MEVKILGAGCAKCNQVQRLFNEAVAETGIDANIEHISDIKDMATYGVLTTPSVVVDGKVVSVGKVPLSVRVPLSRCLSAFWSPGYLLG